MKNISFKCDTTSQEMGGIFLLIAGLLTLLSSYSLSVCLTVAGILLLSYRKKIEIDFSAQQIILTSYCFKFNIRSKKIDRTSLAKVILKHVWDRNTEGGGAVHSATIYLMDSSGELYPVESSGDLAQTTTNLAKNLAKELNVEFSEQGPSTMEEVTLKQEDDFTNKYWGNFFNSLRKLFRRKD